MPMPHLLQIWKIKNQQVYPTRQRTFRGPLMQNWVLKSDTNFRRAIIEWTSWREKIQFLRPLWTPRPRMPKEQNLLPMSLDIQKPGWVLCTPQICMRFCSHQMQCLFIEAYKKMFHPSSMLHFTKCLRSRSSWSKWKWISQGNSP